MVISRLELRNVISYHEWFYLFLIQNKVIDMHIYFFVIYSRNCKRINQSLGRKLLEKFWGLYNLQCFSEMQYKRKCLALWIINMYKFWMSSIRRKIKFLGRSELFTADNLTVLFIIWYSLSLLLWWGCFSYLSDCQSNFVYNRFHV